MNIKLADTYVNQFITTQKGFTLHQGEVKEMDENDVELKSYVEQGLVVVTESPPQNTIITDKVMTDKTVKEVMSENNDVRKNLKETSKPKKKKVEEKIDDFIEE